MATLIFYIDDGREIAVPIDGRVTVGSVEGNDVMVEDAGVSARHAEITCTSSGGYHLRDLGSEAGTKVNGHRVSSRDLLHGDHVSFGRLRGRFFIHAAIDALNSEEQAGKKLREIKDAYNETYAKHATLLGVVTSLANQERQKLASLDRLQTDTLNLETRVAHARGTLQNLEASITKPGSNGNIAMPDGRNTGSDPDKLNLQVEELKKTVAKLDAEKIETERTLWSLSHQRKESEARRDQAEIETARLRAEHQTLSTDVTVLTRKKTDTQARLQEQEARTTGILQLLEEIAFRHATETEKIEQLTIARQCLENETAVLKAEETRFRETIGTLENHTSTLQAAVHEREEKITQAERDLTELQEKHTQTHADLATMRAEKEHHDIEISRLSLELRNMRSAVVDMESRQSAGLDLVRQRQDQIRLANENLDQARTNHEAEIHAHTQALNHMLDQLHAAESHLQESLVRNEDMTLQNLKLEDLLAQNQNAEARQTYLAAQNLRMEEQAARLNSNINLRHGELETVTEQLTRLRVDESALLKIIQTLQDHTLVEQQRFDQSLKTYAEIGQQAADRQVELEATLEKLRGQIKMLEAYLTSLEVWRDEMDEHYDRLAAMSEDSPEAFKLWREIHRKKENIAAHLPAQTGIKPRFNTQVQVVPRGQRPA